MNNTLPPDEAEIRDRLREIIDTDAASNILNPGYRSASVLCGKLEIRGTH